MNSLDVYTPEDDARLVGQPVWLGPLNGESALRLRGVDPGITGLEFAVWVSGVVRRLRLNIGDSYFDAARWAEQLRWAETYNDTPRGGIVGFAGAARICIEGGEAVAVEALAPDEPLTAAEFSNLFAVMWQTQPTRKLTELQLPATLQRIRDLSREGHEPNLRRQLTWLGIDDGEVFALQTIGKPPQNASYLALARSIDEAVQLTTTPTGTNRWGRQERIDYQGVYVIPNRLVGRIDEVFAPGGWAFMPKGVITDSRITSRRMVYLDLDTQRRDESGKPVDLPISATRDELHKTIGRSIGILDKIVDVLAAIGIDRPSDVVALMMSGNGVQLWLALDDIRESPELRVLVKELLAIWAILFDSEVSHVDTAVHDAKRIGPLAGTPKKKGVKKELYRRVTFDGVDNPRRLSMNELKAVVAHYRHVLSSEQRAAVARTMGVQPTRPPSRSHSSGGRSGGLASCNQVPIREVAARLGIDPEKPVCLGCGSGGGTSDVAFLDDRNRLNCKHDRCSAHPNWTAVDLVAKVEFHCDTIKGTKGVVPKILEWFAANFGAGAPRDE